MHFFLLLSICLEDTFSTLADGYTLFPAGFAKQCDKVAAAISSVLAKNLDPHNPLRLAVATYIHSAGIEAGYSFFAPNIPNSHKLVFELYFKDGAVEYDLPHARSEAVGQRITGLLDQVANVRYKPLRELMLKMLAFSSWQEHPAAERIRAVFGYVEIPSPRDIEHGKAESYNFLYAYDFSFRQNPSQEDNR